jgi:hypothetical protein
MGIISREVFIYMITGMASWGGYLRVLAEDCQARVAGRESTCLVAVLL